MLQRHNAYRHPHQAVAPNLNWRHATQPRAFHNASLNAYE